VNHRTISSCILHTINPKMSPDGSTGPSDIDTDIEHAAKVHGVHVFSLDELKEHIEEKLGGGMFGVVYAINGFPGLAVKEIYLNGQPDRLKEITKFELETMSQFSHPGVLKYHQVIEDGDFFYVVMDRYHRNLREFVTDHARNRKFIPKEVILSIVRQLADALAYVHAPYKVNERGDVLPGIVHRDLKPANVLMSRDGERVAIADFGLCKDAQHDGSTLAGTKAYMAPEVFIYHKTSRASDIWALGVIIYELATLELPSFSRNWKPEDAEKFFVPKWKPDLSAIEDDFIKMVLEKIFVLDPIERPTAGDIAILLQTLDISTSELRARDPVSDESHRSYIISDSSSSKVSFSWTPLIRAITDGDIKTVKKHLPKKDEKGARDDIALILAAKVGHAEIVELLDPTDWDGVTALMRAAERGDVEAVRALIPLQKRRTTTYGWYSKTALMIAASCGHAEVVKLLVEHEGGMQDKNGMTALIGAVNNGHAECIKLLVEKEGGIQKKGGWNEGETALMIAAKSSYADCVKLLLEKEAGMQARNGMTALMWAACNGYPGCVKLLLEKEAGMQDKYGWTALMKAVYWNKIECARLLAEMEKCIRTTREWHGFPPGTTALVLAVQRRHDEVVRLLMKHEGEVSGWTKLIYGSYLGDVEAIRNNLHEKGCKDISGVTALMMAAVHGHTKVVKLLVEEEAGMKDNYGQTALMWVAENGHANCVQLLLEKESSMKDEDGRTALMYAARNGYVECVQLLLEKEGGMRDKDGWTALMQAVANNKLECVKLLAEREKNMKTTCEWLGYLPGTTALDIAKKKDHFEIVSIISEERTHFLVC
ncbi:Protein kinase NEK family protein, partial [Giardia duodenalis]